MLSRAGFPLLRIGIERVGRGACVHGGSEPVSEGIRRIAGTGQLAGIRCGGGQAQDHVAIAIQGRVPTEGLALGEVATIGASHDVLTRGGGRPEVPIVGDMQLDEPGLAVVGNGQIQVAPGEFTGPKIDGLGLRAVANIGAVRQGAKRGRTEVSRPAARRKYLPAVTWAKVAYWAIPV